LAIAVIAAGCGDALQPVLCDGGPCATQTSWHKIYQQTVSRKVDVLFVIDDSAAIAPHAAEVATGVADMARALDAAQPALNLHLGFVTTGRCAISARGAACGLAAPDEFLRSEWCRTITNASGSFVDTAACLADLGAADCGPIQPIASALGTLESPAAGWQGFLRPEANLLLIFVAATDDASGPVGSPASVLDLAARVKALKPDYSQVLVSIIGPGDCADGDVPGPRLTAFVEQFGANGLQLGLCGGHLAAAVDRVVIYFGETAQPPCISNILDTDAATPGLQADCTFVEHSLTHDGTIVDTSLPSCEHGLPPCWRLLSGAGGCAGYVIDIARPADWCYEAPSNTSVECLACADPRDPACAVITR